MNFRKMLFKKDSNFYSKSVDLLGTTCTITAYGENSKNAIKLSIKRLTTIHNKFSVFNRNSEISKINLSKDLEIKVSCDMLYLIKKSNEYSVVTRGCFDITMQPLVRLWSIGKKDFKVPSKEEIDFIKRNIGYANIKLNEEKSFITKENTFYEISFAAIAKGFATDELRKILIQSNVENAVINLGGNIFVMGRKVDGSSWRVGIQNPFEKTGEYVGYLNLMDKSVVSSGSYERFSIQNGVRYSHIINPIDGYPIQNNLSSISIISNESIDGDGLSTGLYILGWKKALEIVEELEGIECICVLDNKEIHMSSNLKGKFIVTNKEFSLMN